MISLNILIWFLLSLLTGDVIRLFICNNNNRNHPSWGLVFFSVWSCICSQRVQSTFAFLYVTFWRYQKPLDATCYNTLRNIQDSLHRNLGEGKSGLYTQTNYAVRIHHVMSCHATAPQWLVRNLVYVYTNYDYMFICVYFSNVNCFFKKSAVPPQSENLCF